MGVRSNEETWGLACLGCSEKDTLFPPRSIWDLFRREDEEESQGKAVV